MKISKWLWNAAESPFSHNFTTSFYCVVLGVFAFVSFFNIFPFSEREALNILVFMGLAGIGLKAYQLFRKKQSI